MRIVIYGASDDLIEVDGDLREEFYAQKADDEDGADYVALSCGVLVKVSYDGEWSLRVIESGQGTFRHYPWNEARPEGDELLPEDSTRYSSGDETRGYARELVAHVEQCWATAILR